MGLDGFSMGNLGLNTELTPAQMASQVEHLVQKESEIKIKNVDEMAEDAIVKRKKDDEDKRNKQEFNDGFEQKNDDDEDDDDEKSKLAEKEFENKDINEFSMKINAETEMIEIFNKKTGKTLETINAKDLMLLVSKLNTASGVLVNRKI